MTTTRYKVKYQIIYNNQRAKPPGSRLDASDAFGGDDDSDDDDDDDQDGDRHLGSPKESAPAATSAKAGPKAPAPKASEQKGKGDSGGWQVQKPRKSPPANTA